MQKHTEKILRITPKEAYALTVSTPLRNTKYFSLTMSFGQIYRHSTKWSETGRDKLYDSNFGLTSLGKKWVELYKIWGEYLSRVLYIGDLEQLYRNYKEN